MPNGNYYNSTFVGCERPGKYTRFLQKGDVNECVLFSKQLKFLKALLLLVNMSFSHGSLVVDQEAKDRRIG